MAAQPEQMLTVAAACETGAHLVNSVGTATDRAAAELLAEWKGHGAQAFATRIHRLTTLTPDQAQGLAAAATALRTLAPRIREAQTLARQATTIHQQATLTLDAVHRSNLAAIHAHAAIDDLTSAEAMTAQANAIAAEAWQAATVALNAIAGTSPTLKTATLTTATGTEPVHQPHDAKPKISPDQVKLVTQPDGRRVYSFDGGLRIPADIPGAHRLVEEIKAYMPRFLAGHTAGIEVPVGLSAKNMWYQAAYHYIVTSRRPIPRDLRNVAFIHTSASITWQDLLVTGAVEMAAALGFSVYGGPPKKLAAAGNSPNSRGSSPKAPSTDDPQNNKTARDPNASGGGSPPTPDQLANEGIAQANKALGTEDQVARDIANGHAYDKHVLAQGEYPKITSRADFRQLIQGTINHPTAEKQLGDGRYAYWNSQEETVVITDPNNPDGGTAFRPSGGYRYYQGLK